MSDAPKDQFVCLGVVTGAIGIKGEVRVKTFTGVPEGLVDYGSLQVGPGGREVGVRSVREAKGGVGLFLEGVNDRNAAEALKGVELGVSREALGALDDDETYYHVDLIGLEVRNLDGEVIGDVKMVHDFGGGDVLELNLSESEKTELVPFRMETVPEVKLEDGFLVLAETVWLANQDEKEEGESE